MSHVSNTLLLTLLASLWLSTCMASPLPTCPCREQQTQKVSVCARPLGDPSWCAFHICAPSFECIDLAWSTHTCVRTTTVGTYQCLLSETGMVVKPRPHEDTRCKCEHLADRIVHHVTPLVTN